MSRFLFFSTPVEGHSSSPLTIMQRLVETGHDVTWLAGRHYAERAARAGVRHVAFTHATDCSGQDPFDFFPELRGKGGLDAVRAAFRDVFIPEARKEVRDIDAIVDERGVDVLVTAGPNYGAALVGERRGIPVATIGDGPYAPDDPDVPPFGPALQPWRGPLGRLRNRAMRGVARRVFADVDRALTDVRVGYGLSPDHPGAFETLMRSDLHLQGCVPEFEYPMRAVPDHVRFVGALRPLPPAHWEAPDWWRDLDYGPVVVVTQGTIRPDVGELVAPTIAALADQDMLVVATTGAADPADVGPLPANARATSFIPYERLLARASVFVTNGGYIGTNLALHHGVPVVQIGNTEEKAEIGARVSYCRVGRSSKKLPSPSRIRAMINAALTDPAISRNVAQASASYQRHDAPGEAAALLRDLAERPPTRRTLRPARRNSIVAPGPPTRSVPVTYGRAWWL